MKALVRPAYFVLLAVVGVFGLFYAYNTREAAAIATWAESLGVADTVRGAITRYEKTPGAVPLTRASPFDLVQQLQAAGGLERAAADYVLNHPERFTIRSGAFDAAWLDDSR